MHTHTTGVAIMYLATAVVHRQNGKLTTDKPFRHAAVGRGMGKVKEGPGKGRRHLGPSAPHGPAKLPAYAPHCCTYHHTNPLDSDDNTA